MKKLLIAMMSVASLAFISKADAINSGTTFEGYNGAFAADKDDTGGNNGRFWYTAGSQTDCATLTNTDYTATYSGERPAIAQRAATSTALAVEAEQRLERGIVGYNEETGFVAQDIGSGIYFDTMVQFTATETAPTPTAGDKLVVWLYGSGDEVDAFGIGTNLIVTAGFVATTYQTTTPSNYVVSAEGVNIEPNSWHRLTIKSISDIGDDDGVPGFVVFIDGVAMTSSSAKGDSSSVFAYLNATAKKWDDMGALFPSLVHGSSADQTLSSVSLEGTGMIDDISFTSVAPDFAKDSDIFTLSWDEYVTALSITVGEATTELTEAQVAAKTYAIEIDGTTTVAVAPTFATGYAKDSWSITGAATESDNTFTVTGTATAALTSKDTVVRAYLTIDGVTEEYGTLDAAIAVLAAIEEDTGIKAVLKLNASVVGDNLFGEVFNPDVTLDLNGFTISGSSDAKATDAVIRNECVMIITDTSAAKTGKIIAGGNGLAVYNDWELTIDEGKFNGKIDSYVDDPTDPDYDPENDDSALLTVNGGYFTSKPTAKEVVLKEGFTWTADPDADGYYTLTEGEDPGTTTYTVTVNAGTGTKVTDAPTNPVEENTEVTLTVVLEDGYKDLVVKVNGADASVVDGEVTFTVTADTTVTVSATEMATYKVTIADTLNANVKSITANPTSIREDATSKTVTLTATFENDYELDYFTVNGEKIADNTFELTANAEVNAVAKQTVGPEPEDWPADPRTVEGQTAGDAFGLTGDMAAAPADKVATWAKEKEVSFADRTKAIKIDAYLLNVDNTDDAITTGKAAFKFTSITPGVTPTIEGEFNGVVVVKAYLDAACTTEGSSEKATFYKATLEVTAK